MSRLKSLGAGAAILAMALNSTPAWAPPKLKANHFEIPKLNVPDAPKLNMPDIAVPQVPKNVTPPKIAKTPAGVPLVPDASGKIPNYTKVPPQTLGKITDVPKPKTGLKGSPDAPVNYGALSDVKAPSGAPKPKFRPASSWRYLVMPEATATSA